MWSVRDMTNDRGEGVTLGGRRMDYTMASAAVTVDGCRWRYREMTNILAKIAAHYSSWRFRIIIL